MAFGQGTPTIAKDPSSTIDIGLDLSAPVTQLYQPWLAAGEAVTNLQVTADPGITLGSTGINTNASGVPASLLIAWVSGGTANNTYAVHLTFTTNQGRTDCRSISIQCVSR
jgi:hypothetical protein